MADRRRYVGATWNMIADRAGWLRVAIPVFERIAGKRHVTGLSPMSVSIPYNADGNCFWPLHNSSNFPVFLFFRTLFHEKYLPFIAIYTPCGSVWTNARALPRLNRPSELPNL